MKRLIFSAMLLFSAAPAIAFAQPQVEWSRQAAGSIGHPQMCPGVCYTVENHATAVDADGSLFVVGHRSNGVNRDFLIMKFDPQGTLLWTQTYDTLDSSHDHAYAVAVDSNGDPIVTGSSPVRGTNGDYLTIKYSGLDGSQLWLRRYTGVSTGFDGAVAIAVDAADDVVVTGRSSGTQIGYDYATIKYRGTDGEPLWTSRYNRLTNGNDEANALAIDAMGDVFVTGVSGSGQFAEYATVKYDGSNGALLWSATYAGPPNVQQGDAAHAIAIDGDGNAVVTGRSFGIYDDYATLKYDGATGQALWTARYNGTANYEDVPYALAIDAVDDVYVTGLSRGTGSSPDAVTIKYAKTTGAMLWEARYIGATGRSERGVALSLGGSGHVAIAADAQDAGGIYRPIVIGYSASTGSQDWVVSPVNFPSGEERIFSVNAANDDGFFVGTFETATRSQFSVNRIGAASGD